MNLVWLQSALKDEPHSVLFETDDLIHLQQGWRIIKEEFTEIIVQWDVEFTK